MAKRTLLIYKGGIGDALFVGTIAQAWLRANAGTVYTYTFHPELFEHPRIRTVGRTGLYFFRRLAKLFPSRFQCIDLYYTAHYLKDPTSNRHILELMADKAGVSIEEPIPVLSFDLFEKQVFEREDGEVFVGLQATGSSPELYTKFYFPERFEEMIRIVKLVNGKVRFVQLGLSTDPLLNGVDYDFRGKTSIRGVLSVLNDLDLFVGLVGFLMHGARAVGTPSVIVYGGREKAAQSGYEFNTNLESDIHCSPCWAFDCPIDRACMREIEPEQVASAVLDRIRELKDQDL